MFPANFPKSPKFPLGILGKTQSDVALLCSEPGVFCLCRRCGSGMVNPAHVCKALSPEHLKLVRLVLWVGAPQSLSVGASCFCGQRGAVLPWLNQQCIQFQFFQPTDMLGHQSLWQGNFSWPVNFSGCPFCCKKQ